MGATSCYNIKLTLLGIIIPKGVNNLIIKMSVPPGHSIHGGLPPIPSRASSTGHDLQNSKKFRYKWWAHKLNGNANELTLFLNMLCGSMLGIWSHKKQTLAHILQWAHQWYTSLNSYSTMGTPAIYILGLTFYDGHTSDIHPWTYILQQPDQRYTSLDSHFIASALAIYITGLTFYSGRTNDIRPWTCIL